MARRANLLDLDRDTLPVTGTRYPWVNPVTDWFADRVLLLERGRMVKLGEPEEVIELLRRDQDGGDHAGHRVEGQQAGEYLEEHRAPGRTSRGRRTSGRSPP